MASFLNDPILPSSHDILGDLVARSFLVQLCTAKSIVSLANHFSPFDAGRAGCIRTVRQILESTETRLWKVPLNPTDIRTISAEIERLRFQIDALS